MRESVGASVSENVVALYPIVRSLPFASESRKAQQDGAVGDRCAAAEHRVHDALEMIGIEPVVVGDDNDVGSAEMVPAGFNMLFAPRH